MKTQHTGPLPEGWTLKDGFINYQADDYHKHILDKSGRIDRNAVALTLENYGYPDHARRWFLSPVEMAAPELYRELSGIATLLEARCAVVEGEREKWGRTLEEIKAVLAKVEGRPIP